MRKKINSFLELLHDPKKGAAIKLIGSFIILIILVLYFNLSSDHSVVNTYNDLKNNVNTTSSENTSKDDEELNNYAYNIKIDYTLDNYKYNYVYYGEVLDNKKSITKVTDKEIKYLYLNGHYYLDNKLVTKEEVFDIISYNYISEDMILELQDLGEISYETKYSNGSIITSYQIPLNKLITNYLHEDNVTMNITKKIDSYLIDIDYTSLMKYYDSNISSYVINITIDNIDKIKEIN